MADGPALTIGEVINLLKDEFPDITVSKVRFLESQGLISPARSTSGYRQFHTSEVKRLRFILHQQRDHFLPLKVIKSQLTLWDRGEERMIAPNGVNEAAALLESDRGTVDGKELARQADITRDQLADLVEYGLIVPDDAQDALVYRKRDIAIAYQCGVLMAFGFEPRHLRSERHTAERNADLLRQLTAGLRRNHSPEARRNAADTLAGSADALGKLSALMLAGNIRSFLHED